MAAKYRKKPVVIEAVQWTGENKAEIEAFVGTELESKRFPNLSPGQVLIIDTLEGAHMATHKDWIIKGVSGEFYPCKPGIFDKTYEAVK